MKIGYADPPYPGMAAKHYRNHPDYAGEVDQGQLLKKLDTEYDGWVLHTSSVALPAIYELAQANAVSGFRVMVWVKPFSACKKGVVVNYAWEPVLIKPARSPVRTGREVMRDYVSEKITMRRGLVGVKPDRVCRWAFEMIGAQPEDILDDLFPGTGAVTRAWEVWRSDVIGSSN